MELRAGYKQTEVGVIPEDWSAAQIGNLARFASGKGISVASLQTQSEDFPIPVFGGNGVAGYTKFPTVHAPCVVVGRVGQRCGEVYLSDGPAWITDNALYPKDLHRPIDQKFFALALKASKLNEVKNKNDLPLITQTILAGVAIPLPPIPEQRAIATALSDVDALLAKIDQLIAKKRDLKQAAMQQLLTGQTRLPGFSGEWEVKRLGDLANVAKGRGLSKGLLSTSGSNACILYGELFTTYERVIESVVSKTNSSDGLPGQRGDVLLPGSTTTKGIDLAVASALLADGVLLGGDINVVRMKSQASYDPVFMANLLTHTQKLAIADLAQGSTIIHLYGRNLLNLTLRLPAVAEQTAIATVLSDMDAELAALEARRDKTRALKQGMMQALLTGRIRLVGAN